MKWSPQDAMEAYLQTLQVCKNNYNNQDCTDGGATNCIQPQCMEFISALAAGNQAKLMVQILSNEGVNLLTIALAVAAKHTRGVRFICVLDQQQAMEQEDYKAQLSCYDLEDKVEFIHGNPCEVIMQFKNIDFAAIDCKFEDHLKLFKIIDLNPRGSIVLVNNLVRSSNGVSFGEVVGRKKEVEYVNLLIGQGMELTRLGFNCKGHEKRKHKRFHVTFES